MGEETDVQPASPAFWAYLGTALALVLITAVSAGLNVAILELDATHLQVQKRSGDEAVRRRVKRVEPLLKHHHLVVLSLVLAHAACDEALPIVLEAIMPGHNEYLAVAAAVPLVVLFGELFPAAAVSGRALRISSALAPVAWLFVGIVGVASAPMAWLAEKISGEDNKLALRSYRRNELTEFLRLHMSRAEGEGTSAVDGDEDGRKGTHGHEGASGQEGQAEDQDGEEGTSSSRAGSGPSAKAGQGAGGILGFFRRMAAGSPARGQGQDEDGGRKPLLADYSDGQGGTELTAVSPPRGGTAQAGGQGHQDDHFSLASGTGHQGHGHAHGHGHYGHIHLASADRSRRTSSMSSDIVVMHDVARPAAQQGQGQQRDDASAAGHDTAAHHGGLHGWHAPGMPAPPHLEGIRETRAEGEGAEDGSGTGPGSAAKTTARPGQETPRETPATARSASSGGTPAGGRPEAAQQAPEQARGRLHHHAHANAHSNDHSSSSGPASTKHGKPGPSSSSTNGGAAQPGGLTKHEMRVIEGTLSLATRPVSTKMVPLGKVFSLSTDEVLDRDMVMRIAGTAHSRIPVHVGNDRGDVIGLLLVKLLLRLDNYGSGLRVGSLPLIRPLILHSSTSLLDALRSFELGRAHMALITDDVEGTAEGIAHGGGERGPTAKPRPTGILTLEDCLLEVLNAGTGRAGGARAEDGSSNGHHGSHRDRSRVNSRHGSREPSPAPMTMTGGPPSARASSAAPGPDSRTGEGQAHGHREHGHREGGHHHVHGTHVHGHREGLRNPAWSAAAGAHVSGHGHSKPSAGGSRPSSPSNGQASGPGDEGTGAGAMPRNPASRASSVGHRTDLGPSASTAEQQGGGGLYDGVASVGASRRAFAWTDGAGNSASASRPPSALPGSGPGSWGEGAWDGLHEASYEPESYEPQHLPAATGHLISDAHEMRALLRTWARVQAELHSKSGHGQGQGQTPRSRAASGQAGDGTPGPSSRPPLALSIAGPATPSVLHGHHDDEHGHGQESEQPGQARDQRQPEPNSGQATAGPTSYDDSGDGMGM